MADRLVVVAAHLLGRSQTAPPHDEQQGARDLLGRGPQPVERRALCLAEPGATAQAAVALMSAHMAIAHDMRLLAVAIGARRTGSRWTHRVAPPTLPSSNSYASPVTTEAYKATRRSYRHARSAGNHRPRFREWWSCGYSRGPDCSRHKSQSPAAPRP